MNLRAYKVVRVINGRWASKEAHKLPKPLIAEYCLKRLTRPFIGKLFVYAECPRMTVPYFHDCALLQGVAYNIQPKPDQIIDPCRDLSLDQYDKFWRNLIVEAPWLFDPDWYGTMPPSYVCTSFKP